MTDLDLQGESKKRGRGRPKGAPNKILRRSFVHLMPQARGLYVTGHAPDLIAAILGITSSEVITNWANKNGWMKERENTMKNLAHSRLQEIQTQQGRYLIELDKILEMAFKPIKSKAIAPQKFAEATNAYIAALEMVRKLKVEAVQVSFLMEVVKIIKEEITDPTLLKRIADKFNIMMEQYQEKSLSDPKEIKEPEDVKQIGTGS